MSKSTVKRLAFLSFAAASFTVPAFGMFSATPVSAQSTQTYRACIAELQQVGFYGNNAADRCFTQLQYEPVSETLAQCIAGLQRVGFYGNNAADRCERLLAVQRQNSGSSFNSPRVPNNTVPNNTVPNNTGRILLNTNGAVNHSGWQSYSFTVNGNQTIRIVVNGINDFDPVLTLQDAYGNVLDENDDYGGGLNSQITQTLAPGNYRAIVRGFEGGGNYNIMIQAN